MFKTVYVGDIPKRKSRNNHHKRQANRLPQSGRRNMLVAYYSQERKEKHKNKYDLVEKIKCQNLRDKKA